jgi:recombination protein RecT
MSTEIATQPQQPAPVLARQKPADVLRAQLDARKEMLTLPSHISYEKFCSVVITAVSMDPTLLAADRTSLLTSCLQAAQDGLLLDKKQAALVVFSSKDADGKWIKKVQYMPMVAGVLKKLRNSGEIATIMAECVYERDAFEFELGLDQKLKHVPFVDGDRGKLRCVYAVARLKDGSHSFRVMTLDQVDRRRAVSKSKSGPWVDWYEEMACKTVLRALCKVLPSSSDMDRMIEAIDVDTDLSLARRDRPSLIDAPESETMAIEATSEGEVIE